jgi:hypothetical protein
MSIIYSHYGFTADPKSNWNTVTTKDELTGKISAPYLIYKKKIQGSATGEIQLKVECGFGDKVTIYDYTSNLMSKDYNDGNTYIYNSKYGEAIASNSRTLRKNGEVTAENWIRSKQYRNVFIRGDFAVFAGMSLIGENYTVGSADLAKEEFTFQNGQKIIVEYDEVFSNYVRRCK